MLFKLAILEGIARGDVRLAFRRWHKAAPKDGATVRTAVGVLELRDVREVDEADITPRDAKAAGYKSRDDLLASLQSDGTLYRMRVTRIADDPRIARRADEDVTGVREKLDALDRRAGHPWTRDVLSQIEKRPATLAASLADTLGMEKMVFKRRVRQLKELGLTESLEVGYRLSPRGEALYATLRR